MSKVNTMIVMAVFVLRTNDDDESIIFTIIIHSFIHFEPY